MKKQLRAKGIRIFLSAAISVCLYIFLQVPCLAVDALTDPIEHWN